MSKVFALPEWTKNMPGHTNLTAKDLAKHLGVSLPTISIWVKNGKFLPPSPPKHERPFIRSGGAFREYEKIKAKNFWRIQDLRKIEGLEVPFKNHE